MSIEGISQSDVEELRQQIEAAIDEAVIRLKSVETTAQQRLREATQEHQRLEAFLEELHYRLRIVSESEDNTLITITGPLTQTQILAMHTQEDTLLERKGDLERLNNELGQLGNRLSWLIHQIESACRWVTQPNGASDEEEDEQALEMQPGAGKQVMWAQTIMGQEAERARLAREIHDGPAQVLANTVMRLQFVEQMQKHRPEEVAGELARVRATLQESMKDVRRFIFDLRPASLTDVGLLPTLRQYVRDYVEQTGVETDLNLPENLVLSANQELAVFRIIQEALQNIRKHAEATRIEVNIQQRPGGPVVVTISDNGRGFDPEMVRRSRPSSSGLVSMTERAATVGGTLKIDSRAGVGTTITLVLPTPKA